MKYLIVFAASAALMISAYGQDAKIVPPGPENNIRQPAPTEKILSKADITEYQVSALRIEKLKTDFKISEFNEKVKPHADEQQAWYVGQCKSIGLSDKQIQEQECGLTIGVDLDGKPIMGQDGKPITSKVFHNAPPPVAAKTK